MGRPLTVEDEFVLELTGHGVEQDSLDTERGLKALLAYVEALRATSGLTQQELVFRGIYIEDKCVQLRCRVNSRAAALSSAIFFQGVLDEELDIPRQLAKNVDQVREAFQDIAPDIKAIATIGDSQIRVFEGHPKKVPQATWEVAGIETHRGEIRRVGGARPKVQLKTVYEGVITADIPDRNLAQDLGTRLYEQVDITLEALRDPSGELLRAKVRSYASLEVLKDPLGDVQRWFAPAAEMWEGANYYC